LFVAGGLLPGPRRSPPTPKPPTPNPQSPIPKNYFNFKNNLIILIVI